MALLRGRAARLASQKRWFPARADATVAARSPQPAAPQAEQSSPGEEQQAGPDGSDAEKTARAVGGGKDRLDRGKPEEATAGGEAEGH